MLNIRVTGSDDYGQWIKTLICGAAGSGKTLLSSTFPQPFVASAEGGLMVLHDRAIPHVEIRSVDDMELLMKMLSQTPNVRAKQFGSEVNTIVVDTLDELSRIFLRSRMKSQKHDSATLQDYGWLKEQMQQLVTGLRNLDMHVVLTCHLKSRSDDDGLVTYLPAIEGGFSQQVADYVDLALVLKSKVVNKPIDNSMTRVLERTLQTFPDTKTDWVKDRSGKLPQEILVNFEDDFDRIATMIYGKVPGTPKVDAVTLEGVKDPEGTLEDLKAAIKPEIEGQQTMTEVDLGIPKVHKFTCEDCGKGFSNQEQHDRAQFTYQKPLCVPCFDAAAVTQSA